MKTWTRCRKLLANWGSGNSYGERLFVKIYDIKGNENIGGIVI